MSKARVSLVQGGDRRTNVFNALDLVRADVESRLAEQVMLKPNFLSSHNQLASSHVDALRGVLDFLLSTPTPPREVLIAEAGNEDTWDAYRNFGYYALQDEYPIPLQLLDLHRETEWVETPIVLSERPGQVSMPGERDAIVRMPRTVLDCPCTISIAIPKTHDTCVVTLALKNMIMGTIYKRDRVKMHGFNSHAQRRVPDESQAMSINLIRLARFMAPDVAVLDGAQGLQGNGPGGTDGLDFGVAAASTDVFAADAVIAKTMGFEPLDLGLLRYGHDLGMGIADLQEIEVRGMAFSSQDAPKAIDIESVARQFKPHETTGLQLQWQVEDAEKLLAV